MAYADEQVWSNCSLVACLKYLLINQYRQILSSLPLYMGNVWLRCVPLVKSHFKVRVLWLPPIIFVAVYMMIRCGYIFSRFCFLFKCANISLWLHLVLETSCGFFSTARVLLEVCLVSCRHSFMWSDVVSESYSLFGPFLLLFCVQYWQWCYLHLRSC